MTETDFYVESNIARTQEKISPSGRFKLVLRYYATKSGCWNYSRGTVYRLSDGQQICDIKRNYSNFHHAFITKDSQEWLISGRKYISQTIVNLDTAIEYELDASKNDQFCWADASLLPDGKTLLVDGCYWAAPYEYKFFDFSDPAQGWPELKIGTEAGCLYQDEFKRPVFNSDGTVTCYQSSKVYLPLNKSENDLDLNEIQNLPDGEFDKESNWQVVEDERITLQRQENQMVVVDYWISEAEKDRRQRNEEFRKKFDDWLEDFRKNDPLYLEYQAQLKLLNLPAATSEGYGITYAGWAPNFQEKETRWCRRIIQSGKCQFTVDLEWAVKTGPVKLSIFHLGQTFEDRFYPHSASGIQQAMEYAEQLFKWNLKVGDKVSYVYDYKRLKEAIGKVQKILPDSKLEIWWTWPTGETMVATHSYEQLKKTEV